MLTDGGTRPSHSPAAREVGSFGKSWEPPVQIVKERVAHFPLALRGRDHDVKSYIAFVPEPAALAAIAGGAMVALGRRRRA
jgi:hypothetical protein